MIESAMGWVGTVGTMAAYVMLSRGKWHAGSLRYAALNCLGGVLAGSASAALGAWPSVASNVLWAGVALHSVVVTLRSRRGTRAGVLRYLPARPTTLTPALVEVPVEVPVVVDAA